MTCTKNHVLANLGTTQDNGWACDGRLQPGGCRSGLTDFHQSKGHLQPTATVFSSNVFLGEIQGSYRISLWHNASALFILKPEFFSIQSLNYLNCTVESVLHALIVCSGSCPLKVWSLSSPGFSCKHISFKWTFYIFLWTLSSQKHVTLHCVWTYLSHLQIYVPFLQVPFFMSWLKVGTHWNSALVSLFRLIHNSHQRKFRSSNFRLYWKLPVALAASMFDSRDVSAGRNCAKCCVFP